MIIISECKITQDLITRCQDKGIRLASSDGVHLPIIHRGEAVKFILDKNKLFSININKIGELLNSRKSKHNVTVQLEDNTWYLSDPIEWKHTYQDEHDQLKQITKLHPVYQMYKEKCREYYEKQKVNTIRNQFILLADTYDIDISDEQLDSFVRAFAHLYDLQVDYNSKLDMLYTYYQIKYYLDNDIPYANEPSAISISDEPMFTSDMFDLSKVDKFDNQMEIIPVGDETLFEDLIYKCKNNAKLIDEVIDRTLKPVV